MPLTPRRPSEPGESDPKASVTGRSLAVNIQSMHRWVRTAGSLLLNLLLAIFGTAVVETPLYSLIKVHTIPEIVQRSDWLSALCGCGLGYVVYRLWRPSIARWLWVAGIAWIAFRIILLLPEQHVSALFPAQHVSIWSALSGTGCSDGITAVGCRNWLQFTLPSIRMVAYSMGATVCSRLQHSGPLPIVDAWLGRFRPLKIERSPSGSRNEHDG
jgi:hypothetical protein